MTSNQGASDPLVTVAVDGLGIVDLRGADDVARFISNEESTWQWAYGMYKIGPMAEWIQPAVNKTAELKDALDKYRLAANEPEAVRNPALEALRNKFSNAFTANGPCVHSESPLGIFILEQRQKVGDHSAATAMLVVLRPASNAVGTERGVALGTLYTQGLISHGALDHLKKTNEEIFAAAQANKQEWSDIKEEIASDRKESAEKFEQALKDAAERLERAEKRWREIKEFEEPSGYWEKRSNENAIASWLWLLASIVVGVSGGIGACLPASRNLQFIASDVAGSSSTAQDAFSAWRSSIPLLLPVVLAVIGWYWLLRLLIRNYISQQHLKTDADERVTLAMTYLALRERDKDRSMEKEERLVVLNQLFRHAQSGMVKDDAAPQVPLSILTQLPK